MKLTLQGWALILSSGALAALSAPRFPSAVHAVTASDLDAALAGAATIACGTVSLWVLALACVAALPRGGRLAVMMGPRAVRGLLFAGAAGALSVAAPAAASAPTTPDNGWLTGLRMPDRAVSALPAAERSVTVAPGDTLWHLAEGHLTGPATTARIATATRAWYRRNRDTIGPDPDLIVPGQVLDLPRSATA